LTRQSNRRVDSERLRRDVLAYMKGATADRVESLAREHQHPLRCVLLPA
jgi:hypothetical protein